MSSRDRTPTQARPEAFGVEQPFNLRVRVHEIRYGRLYSLKSMPTLIDPNDSVTSAVQVKSVYDEPVPTSCRERPAAVALPSATPMSVDVRPAAKPSVAVRLPACRCIDRSTHANKVSQVLASATLSYMGPGTMDRC